MGVYIKGMEMPKSCSECFVKFCKGRAKNKRLMVQRGEDCPLVPVPPHGRLIDADALLKDDSRKYDMYRGSNGRDTTLDDTCHRAIQWTIEDAPTILEAEEGE